jgi:hypothetical protein
VDYAGGDETKHADAAAVSPLQNRFHHSSA